jgi:hypothetical protein
VGLQNEVTVHSANEDLDPLVDLSIKIEILKIRSLEHDDPQLNLREIIDINSEPDFYVKLIVNEEEYVSDIKWNCGYIYDTFYSKTVDVPDDIETVDIKIQLWDAADEYISKDRLCDISLDKGEMNDSFDAEIKYNLKNGHWTGDDKLNDKSGYGRLNGCEDGTIYQADRDCELWFDITFNDFDFDQIPYYYEVNELETDPEVNDSETDFDDDKVPTWWEFRYGYDPKVTETHINIDPDNDGISNLNEFRTSQWFSDPFVRDLFVELDQMQDGPNGEFCRLPTKAKEMLRTAYDRQDVIYHLDDGSLPGESGSELIDFDSFTTFNEVYDIRQKNFYDSAPQAWRKEVFHYGVLIWEFDGAPGVAFGKNAFQISAHLLDNKIIQHGFDRDVTYASCYMHEMGHNLAFRPIPGHNKFGWLLRIFLPLYKSCMSYGWMYRMVDYSDGSRPHLGPLFGDYDDWERMNLTFFHTDKSL